MSGTTTSGVPGPTQTSNSDDNHNNSGPTSSPLLFFVALGFGVVFTNLWIIVGVKYCFRYNQRNRQMRALNENGEPIDLGQMPRPHRRRREKKLMTMEEVNERFPLTKYKAWRSGREAEGLPAAGGVTAPPSRAGSVKDFAVDGSKETRASNESARPQTALSMAREDHEHAVEGSQESSTTAATHEKPTNDTATHEHASPRKATNEPRKSTASVRNNSVAEDDDEVPEEDDPIHGAAPLEMTQAPGDACAICLDTLENDDDIRGLTCGHAFHGSCVDPWLTGRRACCPLCKADYYVPKPRAAGEEEAASGRRAPGMRGMNLPQNPPPAWIGARGAMPFRPRMFLGGPRIWMSTAQDPTTGVYATPTRAERRRREADAGFGEATTRPEGQEGGTVGWRSRLPNVRLPGFGGRNQQQQQQQTGGEHGPVEEVGVTPGDLEAGRR